MASEEASMSVLDAIAQDDEPQQNIEHKIGQAGDIPEHKISGQDMKKPAEASASSASPAAAAVDPNHTQVLDFLATHSWCTFGTVLSVCQLEESTGRQCLEALVTNNLAEKKQYNDRLLWKVTEAGRAASTAPVREKARAKAREERRERRNNNQPPREDAAISVSDSSTSASDSTQPTHPRTQSTSTAVTDAAEQKRERQRKRQQLVNEMYEFVCHHPRLMAFEIAEGMNLSLRLVNGVLYYLARRGDVYKTKQVPPSWAVRT